MFRNLAASELARACTGTDYFGALTLTSSCPATILLRPVLATYFLQSRWEQLTLYLQRLPTPTLFLSPTIDSLAARAKLATVVTTVAQKPSAALLLGLLSSSSPQSTWGTPIKGVIGSNRVWQGGPQDTLWT